jgi:chromosome segregation ATPase
MTVTKEDLNRVVRGPADLEEQIDQLKARVTFLQGKCRQAGAAILDLEAQKSTLNKEIDRLSEENSNFETMLRSKNEGK